MRMDKQDLIFHFSIMALLYVLYILRCRGLSTGWRCCFQRVKRCLCDGGETVFVGQSKFFVWQGVSPLSPPAEWVNDVRLPHPLTSSPVSDLPSSKALNSGERVAHRAGSRCGCVKVIGVLVIQLEFEKKKKVQTPSIIILTASWLYVHPRPLCVCCIMMPCTQINKHTHPHRKTKLLPGMFVWLNLEGSWYPDLEGQVLFWV